jgi:hypothetical protein
MPCNTPVSMLLAWPEWRTAWHDPAFVTLARVAVAGSNAMSRLLAGDRDTAMLSRHQARRK